MKFYRLMIPIFALLIAVPALAEVTTVIPFDVVPANVACGETWQENQVDLTFVPTTAEDCTLGSCYFGIDPGAIWLFPSRLMVNFGESYNVTRVEIDWMDYCGQGCTNAFLYNGGATVASFANTVVSGLETATLIPVGGVCDSIGISSCEGKILEVRIIADTVPNEDQPWGGLKAMYR